MTTKRLWLASIACALTVQVAAALAYGWMTQWTFVSGILTTSPGRDLPNVVRRLMHGAALIQHLGSPLQVGDASSLLLSAGVNTALGALVLFAIVRLLAIPVRFAQARVARGKHMA